MSVGLLQPVLTSRLYDDALAFRLLEDEWKALFCQHGGWNVFLSWQWFSQWWAAFGSDKELRILALRDGARLVGIAPMMIETDGAGRRQLALIGSDRTTDYGDLLVDPLFAEPACEAVADFVLKGLGEWERVELRSLPSSSPFLGPFQDAVRRRGMRVSQYASQTCPLVRLAPSWEEWLATLSKKDRHELRRKIRRSQAAGERSVLFLAQRDEVIANLDSFFRLHRASSPEKALFLDESMQAFFRGMASAFADEGWLQLSLMRIDGRDVAASISFCRGDRVLLYNSGFDPNYRAHCVGIALHAADIERAIEEGKMWYDFLRGNEPYKYGFGARDNPIYTVTLPPEDGRGRQSEADEG